MSGVSWRFKVLKGMVLLSLVMVGCQPAELGTISAPSLDRSQGPTTNPNLPSGGESTIPAAEPKANPPGKS